MAKPTFLVIGAAKCGTTTIFDLLGEHPEVFVPTVKEPHFFSRLTRYGDLRPWYSSLFDAADSFPASGEASTSYSHPHRIDFVAPRIGEVLPDCRLIYLVRHPVRRLESDWKMRLREGRVSQCINEAADVNASLITFGLYWKHLKKYREHFADNQLLVVFLEDFASRPKRELYRIFRHIGVDPSFVPDDPEKKRNAASEYRETGLIVDLIRKISGYERLRRAVPEPLVSLTKSLLTEQFDPSPRWDRSALEAVRGYFRPDSRKLLRYCEKPTNFWSLGD